MKSNNKLIVREYIEKVVNTGDINLIEKFISVDYSEVYSNKKIQVGISGAKEHITGVRKTYPDAQLIIDQQISEGDWVVTCFTMRGTHMGSWIGIKPTKRKIEVTGVNVDKLLEGKIVEHGGAANMFEGLLEIGAIKIVGEAEE